MLCLEFLWEKLVCHCWVQESCQKSALKQDLQLGPGDLSHCCYMMQRKSLQPNQKYIKLCCLFYGSTTAVLWRQQKGGTKAKLTSCLYSLKKHNSASRDCFQPARNVWVWSHATRFSSCSSSPFCLRQGILESWDCHNGALFDRIQKLDLYSERTDSCSRGFHNATIYIRKWAEYFLEKKKKRKRE